MCGMKVVVVASDESGNIDLEDLRAKALKHKDNLVRQWDRHNDEVIFLPWRFLSLSFNPGIHDGHLRNVGNFYRFRFFRRLRWW